MFKRNFFLTFMAFALLVVGACKQPATPNHNTDALARERVTGKPGGGLVARLTSPPKTFNPMLAADEASLTIAFFLLNSKLIDFDQDTQKYVPALAENWQRKEDGKTVELTLREGLKFSDGQPLTAEDVAFTLRAIYDERTGSPIFRDAMKIGGKEIIVAVVDARRLLFTFPETVAAPESYLFNIAVVPRHLLEDDFKQGKLSQSWTVTSDPQRIVTSGAFTVQASMPGQRVVLQRNPYYWKKDANGTALPYLDTLTLEIIGDANNTFAKLGQNAIDIADRIRPTDYATLRNAPGKVRGYDLGPGVSTDHLWFNLNEGERNGQPIVNPIKRAWFSDARFRRAVAHAIDRETIAASTLQGLATPLYGVVSPANRAWAAADLPRPDYNLDKAKALLQEAGFTVRGAADAPELYDARGNRVEWTLITPVENEPRKLMAAVIQEDLAKLGMKVQVAPLEFQALTDRWVKNFDYDAVLLGVSLTDMEPSSYTSLLISNSTTHQWYPQEAKPATDWEARLDELVAAQTREIDPLRRLALFHEIQLILAEQLPIIPIVARHVIAAANTRVGNYRPGNIIPYSLWNADEWFVKP
ncbi:MAG: ABC transporter substrate-binding protein [Acidobacteria bacterium]|nr:ABC transporter substrate-binding protein [Acidobacteriota bacterium]